MNVQNVKMNSTNRTNNYKNRANTSFKATPMQIWSLIQKETPRDEALTLGLLAMFFGKLEVSLTKITGAPSKFIYKLGQKNELPASIKDVVVYPQIKEVSTLGKIDEGLNIGNSSEGEGLSLGETAKELLTKLGVEEPDVITVGK